VNNVYVAFASNQLTKYIYTHFEKMQTKLLR